MRRSVGPLHHSLPPLSKTTLYRRLVRLRGVPSSKNLPTELEGEEAAILAGLANAGLAAPQGVLLPCLSQLAFLRHYGGPARLFDVTQNPFVALFFACQPARPPATASAIDSPDYDGRLFLIAIPRDNVISKIPDDIDRYLSRLKNAGHPVSAGPVSDPTSTLLRALGSFKKQIGSNEYVAFWAPAVSMDARINAQHAGFIFAPVAYGAVVGSLAPPGSHTKKGSFTAAEHQKFTDLALRPHSLNTTNKGKPISNGGLFTVRVRAQHKAKLLSDLRTRLNIDFNRLFPDFAGFAQGLS